MGGEKEWELELIERPKINVLGTQPTQRDNGGSIEKTVCNELGGIDQVRIPGKR